MCHRSRSWPITSLGRSPPSGPWEGMPRGHAGRGALCDRPGFVGMTGVYIACVLMPEYMTSARVSLPTLVYAIFTALVSTVFLLSAGSKRADKSVTLRSLQSLSSGYFWMVFAFVGSRPDRRDRHRPEANPLRNIAPYCSALFVRSPDSLLSALVIRFADANSQSALYSCSALSQTYRSRDHFPSRTPFGP